MLGGMFKRSTTPKTAVALTELGKKKAEEFSAEGPKFDVLTVLNDSGPSSVMEIAEETHMSPHKVKAIVQALVRSGYAKPVGNA